jgi:hypothetical protein
VSAGGGAHPEESCCLPQGGEAYKEGEDIGGT